MTRSHKSLLGAFAIVSCSFLSSCVTVSPDKFTMSFLPPAPKVSSGISAALDAPVVPANPLLSESSTFLRPELQIPPRLSQVDTRIQRAEQRYQHGRRLYQEGDAAGARAEFDAAIDVLLSTPETAPDRQKIAAKLEQLVAAIHKFDVNRLGAGDLSGEIAYDKAPLEDILEMTFPVDPGMKLKVKEQLTATASQLPLVMNDSVLSYINYFSSERGRKTIIAGLKRSGRYRPLITKILAEEGVPQELIYLAQAESGFLPRAVSHKAAVGMWQFVQARGRQYGLNQGGGTDDRLDPEKATRSAARHLRDLYQKFGDWYLAIAGYNCGDGCVERAVQRTGYADFWEIRSRNAIPKETTNYVPIILAMTIMHKNAKDYGIDDVELDPPLQYETIELPSPTHVALIADAADRSVSDLRELNPSLLTSVAPAGYELRVPLGARTQVLAGLDTVPVERRASWRIHRVSDGDTLESIARRYNTPVNAIAAANNDVAPDVGDVLAIPTASQVEKYVKTSGGKSSVKRASAKRSSSKRASVRQASSKKSAVASKPARRRIASVR